MTLGTDIEYGIADSLRLFHQPGDVVEIRAIHPTAKYKSAAGYFTDFDAAADAAEQWAKDNPEGNLYFVLNKLNPALLARSANKLTANLSTLAKDDDIEQRRFILLDVDPRRPAGISSSDEELEEAARTTDLVSAFLTEQGWPAPIAAISGNGFHELYAVDLPNNDDSKELVNRTLKAISAKFSTDAVSVDTQVGNASRIVKLYSSMARKGSNLPDRPHRQSQVTHIPESIKLVTREQLETVAAMAPEPVRNGCQNGSTNGQATHRTDVFNFERVRRYLEKVPPAISGENGHNSTFAAACRVVLGFGLTPDEALPFFEEWNQHNAPPWSDHDLRRKLEEADRQPGERGYLRDVSLSERNSTAEFPQSTEFSNSGKLSAVDGVLENSKTEEPGDAILAILRPDQQTDLANARRFVRMHGDRVRYCHAWKRWIVWTGTHWAADDSGAVDRLAKAVADSIWNIAQTVDDPKLRKFATATASRRAIEAMLVLAQSELPISPAEMDCNIWLLNCPNGTIDLRIGELREHRREDCITKLCPVEFHPDAKAPVWEQFQRDVADGDDDLIGFKQRWYGYCSTGCTSEQTLLIPHGSGANGKSTELEAIGDVLGPDYAGAAPKDLLMATKGDRHPTELADLHGKRLIVAQETENNRTLNESLVKALTGGDTIKARRMNENFWQFKPTHKLMLSTNHEPRVKGTDHGIWRRIRKVPFNVKFEGDRRDKRMPDKLKKEHRGILAWIVRGAAEWHSSGLQEPESVTLATDAYRSSQDVIAAFINDCCTLGESLWTKAADLRQAIESWQKEQGDRTNIDGKTLAEGLKRHGCTDKRKKIGRGWQGIGIIDQRHQDSEEGDTGDTMTRNQG